MLNSGKTLIFKDGLEELMQENKKRLTYKMDYKSAYKDSNVIMIAVRTTKKRQISYLKSHLPYENNGIDEFLLFIKKRWTNCSISDILMVKTVNL
jgi:UDP-glucose 6-dehydrogenase